MVRLKTKFRQWKILFFNYFPRIGLFLIEMFIGFKMRFTFALVFVDGLAYTRKKYPKNMTMLIDREFNNKIDLRFTSLYSFLAFRVAERCDHFALNNKRQEIT